MRHRTRQGTTAVIMKLFLLCEVLFTITLISAGNISSEPINVGLREEHHFLSDVEGIRDKISLHKDHRQPVEEDFSHIARRSVIGHAAGTDLGTPYPTSCEQLRKVADKPLPSGTYKIYVPGSEHHEAHGFRPEERHVFCQMDGEEQSAAGLAGVEDISINVYEIPPLRRDCSDIKLANDSAESGVYTLRHSEWWIPGELGIYYLPIFVWCDMDTDGGGWTVIQRRFNGSVDFYRPLADYERGFGAIGGEHWLGLRFSTLIIAHTLQSLRIDMVTRTTGTATTAVYKSFDIEDADSGYRLTVDHYSAGSNPNIHGDQMQQNNGMQFSAHDRDRDGSTSNCAQQHRGGYWYNDCTNNNLNGMHSEASGDWAMFWGPTSASDVQVSTQIAFRQACFE